MLLLIAFIAIPILEIALFIQVGGAIGLWPTLAVVFLTAIAGTFLVRTQGKLAIGQLQESFSKMDNPTEPLAHGAMILIAGALLLTPGFFTDLLGFALLMPPFRVMALKQLKKRVQMHSFTVGTKATHNSHDKAQDEFIDGEYSEIKPRENPPQSPSGWTRH